MMAAANPGKIQPHLLNKCFNCMVFRWRQPEEVSTLRRCKQCKMVQYCSDSCQEEHWKLVHKKHCKEIATIIASYREIGDDLGVSEILFSHHPFSAADLQDNPMEALVMLAQKILAKMQFKNRSAYSKVSSKLAQLQSEITEYMALTCANKKICPGKFFWPTNLNEILVLFHQTKLDIELASQDLWSILHLVLGRLSGYRAVDSVNSLKNPLGAVPVELWDDLHSAGGGPIPQKSDRSDQRPLWRPAPILPRAGEDFLWWQSKSDMLFLQYKDGCGSSVL